MLGLLIGRLGMSKADALTITAKELEACLRHATKREQDDWRRTRWLATVLVNVSGKTVRRTISEKELLRFNDEQKTNGFSEFLKAAQDGQRYKQ